MDTGVMVVAKSQNVKLGRSAATYVSQSSCPDSCALKSNGCYAEHGPVAWSTTSKVNGTTRRPVDLARVEARLIDELPGDRPLRVHTVGDCRTDAAARVVSAAMERYSERGNTFAWTYTHAWREVKRDSWGSASVLASTESVAGIRAARARGYAAAIIVAESPSERLYKTDGEKVIPCPAEAGKTTCDECGLCTRTDFLFRNRISISFAAHGARKKTVEGIIGGAS